MIASREFWVFFGVGGVATGAHYALLVALVQLFHTEPTLASTAGFILGAAVNYVLNYRITFRSTRAHLSAIPRFVATAASGMLLNALLVALGVHGLRVHYLFAQAVSTIIVLFWNFSINKHWTFSGPLPCPPVKH